MQVPFRNSLVFLFVSSALLTLSACSLYKSDGRKKFESSAQENLSLQEFKPIQCDDISAVSYWYETRLTSPQSEWIESLPHLEVWQDKLAHNQIQIRTYERHNDQPQQIMNITRCLATFSSLEEWREFRSFYLKSLEGEQL